MAIASWASLGGGQLTTREQREKLKDDPNAGHGYYEATENDIKVCEVLEDLADKKGATLQDIVSFHRRHSDSCPDFLPRHWRTSSISPPTFFPLSVCRL